jgi:hypothetical protein
MNLEQKVREMLGNLMMQNMALAAQVEDLQKQLETLKQATEAEQEERKANGSASEHHPRPN